MARKKNLGNPLLIAAGAELATKVAANEIDARRQRAAEQRQAEKVQQQQDELAANQIYAKQRGVDLVAASYLRRRRNRIIAYSVLGVGAAATVAYFVIRAGKIANVSEEANGLKSAIPPGIWENEYLNKLAMTLTGSFFPGKVEYLKKKRIETILEIAGHVQDLDKLKKDYKLITGIELQLAMNEHCSPETWYKFIEIAKISEAAAKSGAVKQNVPPEELPKDGIVSIGKSGLYVVSKGRIPTYKYDKGVFYSTMDIDGGIKDMDFIGYTTGEVVKMDMKVGYGEDFKNFWRVSGKFVMMPKDYWVKESDVLFYEERQRAIDYLNVQRGNNYGNVVLAWSMLSGICAPCRKLRCIKNTSINGQIVRKGQNLGNFIPEKSTQERYAFTGSDNKLYYVPKQVAAIIV